MSDNLDAAINDAAATTHPANAQTPIPTAGPITLTFGVITAINQDGSVQANIGGDTSQAPQVLIASDFVPAVGAKMMVLEVGNVLWGINLVADWQSMGGGWDVGDYKETSVAYTQATAPAGWLVPDGSAQSRVTYSELFAKIGTTYGSGNGSTTFNIPNRQDTMPIGAGNTYTVTSTGGAATVTITSSFLPGTSPWTINDPTHTHTKTIPLAPLFGQYNGGGNSGSGTSLGSLDIQAASTGISLNTNFSGGNALTTISPYHGVQYLLKT